MKNSGVEWIGEIPDDWEVRKFKYFFDIYGGSGFKEEYQGQENGDFPFCKASDINGTEKNLISAKNYVNQDLVDKESYIIIPKNSILVSKIGEALKKNHRKVNLVNCIVDNNCEGFVLNSKNDINYLYYVLKCIDMSWFDNGGTIPSINNFKLKNFLLPNCLYEKQQRIASYLDKKCSKIEETIQNQQLVIEKLKAYKQSLITEAVTGKIKIENGKICGEYESYKKSGIDWIETIPDTWCVCKIKYICTMQAGKTLSSEMISEKGLYPVYGGNGKRGFYTEYNTEGKYILIGRQGALCGNVHLVNGKFWATEHAVVTTPNRDVGINYLFYLLSSMNLNQYVSSTAAQPGLSVSTIINLKTIIIKSIDDQKSIVDYLDKKCTAIDTAIEQKQELIVKLTEYKKSLIYEVVTGKKEI